MFVWSRHTSHIGAVSSLLIRPATGDALVSTRAGVLAAISTGNSGVASGERRWRQVLPEGERIGAIASYSKLRVVSVSSLAVESPAMVRAWTSKDGALVWESSVQTPKADIVANQTSTISAQRKARVQGISSDIETERGFDFTYADVAIVADSNADGKGDVLAMQGSVVALLSGVDGTTLWTWQAPDASFRGVSLLVRDDKMAVVGTSGDANVQIYVLRLKDASEVSSRKVAFKPAGGFNARNLLALPASGSALLLQGDKITIVSAFDSPVAPAKDAVFDLTSEALSASHFELLGSTATGSIVAVYGASKQVVVEVPAKGAAAVVNRFTSATKGEDVEFGWISAAADTTVPAPLIRAALSKGALSIEAFALKSDAVSATLVHGAKFASRGGLKQLWVGAESTPKGLKYRAFLSAVDESFSLFESAGKPATTALWTREEALASVLSLQFVELPVGSAEDAANEEAGKYPSFVSRLIPQLRDMIGGVLGMVDPQKVVVKAREVVRMVNDTVQTMANPTNVAPGASAFAAAQRTTYSRLMRVEDRASMLSQDYFGFRKLLLVSTVSGKLFALESQSGCIVWMRFLRLEDDSHEADEQVTPAWKVHVLSHHEAVAIVQDDNTPTSHLVAFNPITGETLRGASVTLDFRVATAIVLPMIDSHSRHILLVASASGALGVYPAGEEAREIVRSHASEIFFYNVDIDEQVLRGFSVAAGKAKGSLESTQSWLVRFPAAQERLVAVSARPAHEVVQSAVRVLGGGDGGYLYKYLNPNLLAVATVRVSQAQQNAAALASGSPAPAQRVVPSLKRTTDPSVNVYLLDSVTGAVLEKIVHRGAEGPVTLLQSENSVTAHFYNAASGHYELSAVELFESRGSSGTGGAGSIGASGVVAGASSIFDGLSVSSLSSLASLGSSRVPPFNSFAEPAPQSLQQSFSFRSAVKTLGVTQTRRGITSKEILIGLPTDQLYALPKALVDPRRPIAEPTPLERAEGLIPYSAEIPVDRLRIVSHVHSIAHLRGVASSHALLESTSLVCAWGVDLFCTRVTPSQTFDLLNEDFNTPFLIATVSAVFIAILWTRRMARAKELAAAWK